MLLLIVLVLECGNFFDLRLFDVISVTCWTRYSIPHNTVNIVFYEPVSSFKTYLVGYWLVLTSQKRSLFDVRLRNVIIVKYQFYKFDIVSPNTCLNWLCMLSLYLSLHVWGSSKPQPLHRRVVLVKIVISINVIQYWPNQPYNVDRGQPFLCSAIGKTYIGPYNL